MIEARNLRLRLGGRPVLDGISLTISSGEIVAVIGANGAGKSTLLKCLSGELAPDAGDVMIDGRAVREAKPAELARRRAVLPQAGNLAFPFTAYEIVRLGAEAGGARPQDEAALCERALREVGLEGFGGRMVPTLSGGEAQRVHLARALAQIEAARRHGAGECFLMLDEPTASLDLQHQLLVARIARARAGAGIGVIAILHDLNLAALTAERIVALADGRVVADGSPATILTDDLVEAVYGVRLPVSVVPQPARPFVLPQFVD